MLDRTLGLDGLFGTT